MDFAIGVVNSVLNLPDWQVKFLGIQITAEELLSILRIKLFFTRVKMTLGLVHANYSLPEWQAVRLTDFASWKRMFFLVELAGICGEGQRYLRVTPSK